MSAHSREIRRRLWKLVTRCMKLHGTCVALMEQMDLFGHELDSSDVDHLYDRVGLATDAWQELITCDAWRSVDEAEVSADDE